MRNSMHMCYDAMHVCVRARANVCINNPERDRVRVITALICWLRGGSNVRVSVRWTSNQIYSQRNFSASTRNRVYMLHIESFVVL